MFMRFYLFLSVLITIFYCRQNISAQEKTNALKDNNAVVSTQDNDSKKSEKDIVVVATRLQTPKKEIASSVTSFDSYQIGNTKKNTVADVLTETPGLTVLPHGGPGQITYVSIRGAKTDHTLVLLDGIELNDPFSPSRAFDFGYLDTTNVERIEVVRGPQSTLYGSDAIGGVVNIITKRGSGKPKFFASSEMGSFETFRETAGLSGGTSLFNYSFEYAKTDSQGFSSATHTKGNREEDSYSNSTLSTRLGITPTENIDLSTVIRYTDADVELDDFAGVGGDDPNYFSKTDQFLMRNEAKITLFDDIYEHILGFSYSKLDRDAHDKSDAHDMSSSKAFYDSGVIKLDSQHNIYIPEFQILNTKINNVVTAGLEYEREKGRSRYQSDTLYDFGFGPFYVYTNDFDSLKHAVTDSFFMQDKISINNCIYSTFGVRWDHHSQFGTYPTFRIAPAMFFDKTGTKLKTAYGTGFKAPTLYQLYTSASPWVTGNPNLKPETSEGWEAGFEQNIFTDKLRVGLTYFENNFHNNIEYKNLTYENIDESESSGLEFSTDCDLVKNLQAGLTYTYLHTKDLDSRQTTIRRPKNSLGLNLNYSFLRDKANINCNIKYTGGSFDNYFDPVTFASTRTRLSGYTVVNITAKYKVTKNIEVFGKIVNLLDDYYETVYGYGTQGFSLFGGAKVEI